MSSILLYSARHRVNCKPTGRMFTDTSVCPISASHCEGLMLQVCARHSTDSIFKHQIHSTWLSFFLQRIICFFQWRNRTYWARASFWRLHDHTHLDTSHSVELLWTSDQPDAETSTWQHTTLKRDRIHAPGRIRTRNPSMRAAADPYYYSYCKALFCVNMSIYISKLLIDFWPNY